MAQYFGCVIAGRPMLTDFTMIDIGKCVAQIPRPAEVHEICFFLLPGASLPVGNCAVLYWTADGVQWSVLGAISINKQSGIFRTSWPTDESLRSAPAVQLGVSVEPDAVVANLDLVLSGVDDRQQSALKIAQDLFDFMASFAAPAGPSGVLAVPAAAINRWLQRFQEKYARDPNFFLKRS